MSIPLLGTPKHPDKAGKNYKSMLIDPILKFIADNGS
jgi:hypothetical protein